MKRMRHTLLWVLIIGILVCASGCGKSDSDKPKSADQTVAIEVGDSEVYLDEVRYYMYSSQATYEIYFITRDTDKGANDEIDWSAKRGKTTWENAVKGSVLNDIARREYFYGMRKDYNIKLDDKAKQDIQLKIENYYTGTDEKLKSKIDIKKSRLEAVFKKAYIASMVEDVMNTVSKDSKDKDSADASYSEWIDDNDIECQDAYFDISFDEHIFTKADMNLASGNDDGEEENVSQVDDDYNPVDNGGINVNEKEIQ